MRKFSTAMGIFLFAAPASAMTIASSDFKDGDVLPMAHVYPRCGGRNVSPELHWSGVPKAAKSLVLAVIDGSVMPNGWSHWIVVDLAPMSTGIARGASSLPAGAKGVASNFGDASYDGPCPPKGTGTHHYIFTLWAMPLAHTELPQNAKATDVDAALSRSAIGHAAITASVTP